MKCYYFARLIIGCLLLKCMTSLPFALEANDTSKDFKDIQPKDEISANISLARLLQQNSEFIGQGLLRNILGVFNRAGLSSTEKGLAELTSNFQTNDQLENEQIDDLSPVKILDDTKYISGSYEPNDCIGSSDEIARDAADYFEKSPKLHSKCKTSKKSGRLNASRKKLKTSRKIYSDTKAGREKKKDNSSLDDGHVLMVLDATNNSTQLDPLYVVIQSKDGNLTSVINNRIFNTRAKLFDLIRKMGFDKNTTMEPSTALTNNDGCVTIPTITESLQIPAGQSCVTISHEIPGKTQTSSSNKVPLKIDQGQNSTSSEHPPLTNKQPSVSDCLNDNNELKSMFLKVYVPLSVQLEPLLAAGKSQYVIKSISIDNSNDYKSMFGNDHYDKLLV